MIQVIGKTHSRMATIIVAFGSGSRVESKSGYNHGVAHMLEHCIFKGTEKRTNLEIQKNIAFLGGFSNAFTSHEMIAYYITVPYENLEPCLDILSDMVFCSTFPEEEFLKEKEVVKEEEVSSLDDTPSFMWREFSSMFFDNYLSDTVIGTQESIDKFSRNEVERFHSEYCQRKDAVISLCSNLRKKDAKSLLRKYFGLPNGKIKRSLKFKDSNYKASECLEAIRPGIEHTYVWMGMPSFKTASSVEPACQVLMTILGRGMDCRLFTEVRENRGLVYGISAGFSDWQNAGVSLVDFSTRDSNVDDALEIVDRELDRIKMELCSDEEVQRAKNKLRSSFYSATEDSYSIAFWRLKEKMFKLPTIEDYMSKIESITKKDIMEAANLVFDKDKRLMLICRGPEDSG